MAGKISDTLKIVNTSLNPIGIDIRGPMKPNDAGNIPPVVPVIIKFPPRNQANPTIVEGEQADRLLANPCFRQLTDTKVLIVNREPKMGEETRAIKEFEAPASLTQQIMPGTTVANLRNPQSGSIDVGVRSVKIA